MLDFIYKRLRDALLWLQRFGEVARFDGIILSDVRTDRKQPQHFRDILLASLSLLKDTDCRRFERVRRRLAYIVNVTLKQQGIAQYEHDIRTCSIDFLPPSSDYPADFLIGWYACTLIHEATHGEIQAHGILYTEELRSRIERLCVREEQRFVVCLHKTRPELAKHLRREFDASDWNESWNSTGFQNAWSALRRSFSSQEE